MTELPHKVPSQPACDQDSDLESLLDPSSPQKLLYSFYIVDWLGRPARLRRFSGIVDSTRSSSAASAESASGRRRKMSSTGGGAGWVSQFIAAGGLRHLFRVFLSGILGRQGELHWSEWKLDCLGFLLRLLVQFGVHTGDVDTLADQLLAESSAATHAAAAALTNASTSSGGGSGKKRNKWNFSRNKSAAAAAAVAASCAAAASANDRLQVATLSSDMLELMRNEAVVAMLGEVFADAGSRGGGGGGEACQYKTGLYGRAQVIHFAMSLLVSWVFSSQPEEVNEATFRSCDMSGEETTLLKTSWTRHDDVGPCCWCNHYV